MDTAWISQRLSESGELKKRLATEQAENIAQASQAMVVALTRGGKVLLFGNGGSAADAQHIAAEFVGRFALEREPLSAIALTTDTSALTAIGNDYGFDQVFARQVGALGRAGDVVVAISTSGRSANVLSGVKAARERGLITIGLTGGDGGMLGRMVDIPIIVPSPSTARVQECHITIGHILCELVEAGVCGGGRSGNAVMESVSLHLATGTAKVVDWEALLALRRRWRAEGKTVVWTNGCFDLLHVGHVYSLKNAKSLGDILIVGVNSDESVRQLKGLGRPIVPASERVEVLAALECVDYVIVFHEYTPELALSRLQPDIHCKGAEYAVPNGKPIPEEHTVKSYCGRIEFLSMLPSVSTSDLIWRIRAQGTGKDDGEGL
jgi:D-sedoheptulose 7-phosphate isomerase